jgi:3-methylcrotonyl-CoA carboxylase alpha subunit
MANVTAAPGRYTVETGGERYAVEVAADNRVRVNGGEPTLEAEPLGRGEYRVSCAVGSWHVFVTGAGADREVFVDGEVYRCEVQPEGAGRRPGRSHLEALASPMPARVVSVNVRPGEGVRRGDVLITLEAMKMELSVRAPRDGVLRAVHCEPGQLVQPGIRLAELD